MRIKPLKRYPERKRGSQLATVDDSRQVQDPEGKTTKRKPALVARDFCRQQNVEGLKKAMNVSVKRNRKGLFSPKLQKGKALK